MSGRPVMNLVLSVLLVLVAMGGLPPRLAAGETSVDVETRTEVQFPRGMTFAADFDLPGGTTVESVALLYRIATDPTLNLEIVTPGDFQADDGQLRVETFVDFLTGFVPLGVELSFSWEVALDNGEIVTTSEETTHWMDNRFEWRERTSDQVRLFTYDTSDDFAEMMLAESQATIDALQGTYDLEPIPPLSIWVYPSYQDFRGTLQGNSREAIAGVTYPGMDTMVVIVPDGDDREFGRVVPHEISHQVLFAATRNAYGPPPLWFDEGMATHTQIGGTEHYFQMAANANREGTLFDIQSLETSFPFQPAQATLAYASAWSMITYIEERWGPEGIARLIDAFGEGLPVEQAIPQALDITVDELNRAWKAWLSIEGSKPIAFW
jgi:hypothetical protein